MHIWTLSTFLLLLFVGCSSLPINANKTSPHAVGLERIQQWGNRKFAEFGQKNVRERGVVHNENADHVSKQTDMKRNESEKNMVSNFNADQSPNFIKYANSSESAEHKFNNTRVNTTEDVQPILVDKKIESEKDESSATQVKQTRSAAEKTLTEEMGDMFNAKDKDVQEDNSIPGVPRPQVVQNEIFNGNYDDENSSSSSSSVWSYVGTGLGLTCVVIVIAIVIVNKSLKANEPFLEKFDDYNGPPSFEETISLPSNTDGSVSQGEQSMKDEDNPAAKTVDAIKSAAQIPDSKFPPELELQ